MENFVIISFKSTHDAIKSESLVTKGDIKARLIPTPSEISAGCGLSLRVSTEDEAKTLELLNDKVVSDGLYYLSWENGKRKVVKKDG